MIHGRKGKVSPEKNTNKNIFDAVFVRGDEHQCGSGHVSEHGHAKERRPRRSYSSVSTQGRTKFRAEVYILDI